MVAETQTKSTWRSAGSTAPRPKDVEGGWRVENGRRRFVAGEAGGWRNREKDAELSSKKFRNASHGHYIGMKKSNPQRQCNKEMAWRNRSPKKTFTAIVLDDLSALAAEVPEKNAPVTFTKSAQDYYSGVRSHVQELRVTEKGSTNGETENTNAGDSQLSPSELRRRRFKTMKMNAFVKPPSPSRKSKARFVVAASHDPESKVRLKQGAPFQAEEPKMTLKPTSQTQPEEKTEETKMEIQFSPKRVLSTPKSSSVATGVVSDSGRIRLGIALLLILCAVATACGYGLVTDLLHLSTRSSN